jgi:Rab-GTPase-TBC domain
LRAHIHLAKDSDPEEFDTSKLPAHVLNAIEADSFWCLSRLLDGIQDNYIQAQPGIQRSVRRMAELVARIDGPYITRIAQTLMHIFNDSTSRGPSRSAERGVHAVCIQMDELLIDARDQCEEHHSDVGYISGTFFEPLLCGRGLI